MPGPSIAWAAVRLSEIHALDALVTAVENWQRGSREYWHEENADNEDAMEKALAAVYKARSEE